MMRVWARFLLDGNVHGENFCRKMAAWHKMTFYLCVSPTMCGVFQIAIYRFCLLVVPIALARPPHIVKDEARNYAREPIARDDEQPDAPEVREEKVDVLEQHALVSLPHGTVDLHSPRRLLRNLPPASRIFRVEHRVETNRRCDTKARTKTKAFFEGKTWYS